MKKINSNGYGSNVIGVGLMFAVVIPFLLELLIKIGTYQILEMFSHISFVIGTLILCLFTIWLLIEAVQDRYWNKYFNNHRNVLLKLRNGNYECQVCGNQNNKETDRYCKMCGTNFQENINCNTNITQNKKRKD